MCELGVGWCACRLCTLDGFQQYANVLNTCNVSTLDTSEWTCTVDAIRPEILELAGSTPTRCVPLAMPISYALSVTTEWLMWCSLYDECDVLLWPFQSMEEQLGCMGELLQRSSQRSKSEWKLGLVNLR